MNPLFIGPLGISRLPGMKDLIEEAPLHLFLARHPNVVGSPGRLGDLVVAVHMLLGGKHLGGQHLRTPPFARGCYELWLRSDSMRACRTESLTQVTFPTKNGRLSPLTWRSLEKTLPSAPTICERFSTA